MSDLPICPPSEHELTCYCGLPVANHNVTDHYPTQVGCAICQRLLADLNLADRAEP